MKKKPTKPAKSDLVNPYKKDEFQAFLELLGDNNKVKGSWTKIAEAIGVDRETIGKWKQRPEAKAIIQKAIKENMEMMIQAGSDDWRMYQANLKMLGLNFEDQKVDLTSKGEKIATVNLTNYKAITNDEELRKLAAEQVRDEGES